MVLSRAIFREYDIRGVAGKDLTEDVATALAGAYAEAGRFTEAVTTAKKAINMARVSGDEGFAHVNEQLLQLYEAGKPYHGTANR